MAGAWGLKCHCLRSKITPIPVKNPSAAVLGQEIIENDGKLLKTKDVHENERRSR